MSTVLKARLGNGVSNLERKQRGNVAAQSQRERSRKQTGHDRMLWAVKPQRGAAVGRAVHAEIMRWARARQEEGTWTT